MKARSPRFGAGVSLVIVAATLPLLFSAALPDWAPVAATVFLALALVGRAVLSGHLTGHTPADWPLLLLLLLLPVGLSVTPDLGVTAARSYAVVAGAALFWVGAAQRNQPWLRYSGWMLLLAGLALAVAVLAATRFPAPALLGLPDVGALQGRIALPFLQPGRFNPNLSGALLALFLPPALVLAVAGDGRPQRMAAALTSALLAALLLLSQSRGAILGVLVAVAAITTVTNRRWLWLWVPLGLAALGLLRIFWERLSLNALVGGSGVVATLEGRQELWSRGIMLIQDFPFTGVGLGMPEPVIKLLYPLLTVGPENQWLHVHNTFLQTAAEMGVPGLIALLAVLLGVTAALVRQARRPQAGIYRGLALGLLGSMVVFVVHGLVDAPMASPKLTALFFGLMGLMAAVAARRPRRRRAEPTTP